MRVLEGLKPETVFYYFEEICKIPHGSGNTQMISDYLAQFAYERNLEHYQDELGNIIMIKEASEGYEDAKPVMLQGHMDMVAVKKPDYDIDMTKDGLKLQVIGDSICAEGTSLGGDDGIAVAYGLALMDDKTLRHPRLELVITVDEEVGMDGARAIDLSVCKAKTLINLDSEEEGIFLAGCAGGARVNYCHDYPMKMQKGTLCRIKVAGLLGGHSGTEIHKERGNANVLLVRVLKRLSKSIKFTLLSLDGGLADNAIPREAVSEILLTDSGTEIFDIIEKMNAELKDELADKDAMVLVEGEILDNVQTETISETDTSLIINLLHVIPNGVQATSATMEGLIETSLNIGILRFKGGILKVGISVRSCYESAKMELIVRLQSLAKLSGVSVEVTGDYPGWVYRKESPLRERMVLLYEKMYGKKPEIEAIHAGLECGIFANKIAGLDCVSIGPDMKDIHTTEEELSISSTERVYLFLVKLLEEMK